MHYQCSCTTLLQRCAVEHCSKHGPFVLTTSDELAAAQLSIRFRAKCRGHHLCNKHRAQIPGRQRQAGVDAVEAAAEREKTEASTAAAAARDDQMYARGYQDGYMAADERKRDARRSPSVIATLFVLAVLFAGISFGQAEILINTLGITLPCSKKEFYAAQPGICKKVTGFLDDHLVALRAAVAKEQNEGGIKGVYASDGSWSGRRNALAGSVYVALVSPLSKYKNKIVARYNMVKASWSTAMDSKYNEMPYRFGASKLMESTGLLYCMRKVKEAGLKVWAAVHDQDVSAQRIINEVCNEPGERVEEFFDPNHQLVNLNKFVNEHLPYQTKRVERLYRHVFSYCLKHHSGPNADLFKQLVLNSE